MKTRFLYPIHAFSQKLKRFHLNGPLNVYLRITNWGNRTARKKIASKTIAHGTRKNEHVRRRLFYITPPPLFPKKKKKCCWKCPGIWLPDLQQISNHTNACFPAFRVRTDGMRVEKRREGDSSWRAEATQASGPAAPLLMGTSKIIIQKSARVPATLAADGVFSYSPFNPPGFSPIHPSPVDILFNFVNDSFFFFFSFAWRMNVICLRAGNSWFWG